PWYRPSLTVQIMIGLVVGGAIGWLRPDWGNAVYFLRDIFINLIKSIIAPLVFSTVVVGIAGAGALRKVGRMGVKALVYFEIVTTAALFIGLAVVNFTKPGAGVTLAAGNIDIVKTIEQSHPKTLVETIVHAFPSSVIDAMVRGDVLQIVAFIVRLPIRQFFRAVREPAALAFATTSSESALPKAMQAMERFGVPRHIVGFVMPTGYSFNMDGSTLYLAMASVFVAQAAET